MSNQRRLGTYENITNVANLMENQSEWVKINTGNIYIKQRHMLNGSRNIWACISTDASRGGKKKQLGIKLPQMHRLIGKCVSVKKQNKFLLYKLIRKPIWTCGIQMWGSESSLNLVALQHLRDKVLWSIVIDPWNVPNDVIAADLHYTKCAREKFVCK